MREIKFRAWVISTQEMIVPVRVPINSRNNQGIVYMQYTGLKDILTKEIYEGDILRASSRNPVLEKVFWNESHSCFEVEETTEGDYYPLARYAAIHKVIGNIYENPDLLK